MNNAEPASDCRLCPRLAGFRDEIRAREPRWFNGPVPTFGAGEAGLLVVGLAPGLRGANRTGRPFTGDFAGDLLYAMLLEFGFATGVYDRRSDDGLALRGCAVTNAVRCVPPQNKPLPIEIRTCRTFLQGLLATMGALRAILVLGHVAHESVLRALEIKVAAAPFAHGRRHDIARRDAPSIALFDSYHCSRYNTNTGVLTEAMFREVLVSVQAHLQAAEAWQARPSTLLL